MERNAYEFPPPRNVPRQFLDDECFSSYVRPQDRSAEETAKTKMSTWMLNMLAIDGNLSSSPTTTHNVESNAQLWRRLEMWRARALFLKREKTEQANQIAGTKRKYDEIREENKAEMQKQKDKTSKLESKKDDIKNQLMAAQEQLKEHQQRKGHPL